MKINICIFLLSALAINFAYGQSSYTVKNIEQLDIEGFNLKLSPHGDKLLYTTRNFKGLWLYTIEGGNRVEVSSKNGVGYEPLITNDYIFYKSKDSQSTLQRLEIASKNKISINQSSIDQSPKAFYACEGASEILEAKASKDLYRIVLVYRDGKQIEIAPLGKKNYLNISVSPDGAKLLFRVSGLGSYITQLDGTVISEFKTAEFPVWLNENEIVFAEVQDDGHQYKTSDLFIASIDGSNKFNLTPSINAIAMYPSVSVNKSRIVFNTPDGEVYLISLETK